MSTSFRKLEIHESAIVDGYFVEEMKIYSNSSSIESTSITIENFRKKFWEKYDVWEIIDNSGSIGVFAFQVKECEGNIKILTIDWIFVSPNRLTVKLVKKVIEESKKFHKNKNIDKVELILNPSLSKEEEQIYTKAGLEVHKTPFWTMILGCIADVVLP